MRRSLLFRVSALAVVAVVLAWVAKSTSQWEPWQQGVWLAHRWLTWLAFAVVTLPVLSILSIGALLFLLAPLMGRKGGRWRTPTMHRLRWAFIGASCAGVGLAVYQALEFTRYPTEARSFHEAFWPALVNFVSPSWTMALVGLASVAVGLWALRRWRPTTHGEIERLGTPAEQSDSRLRWAFVGMVWIATCVAIHIAFEAWVHQPILFQLAAPGPDGIRPSGFTREVFLPSLGLYVLPKLAIPVFVSGLIAADWWFVARRRMRTAQLSTA